nr:MAG TPA: ECF sigma factor [Caudoviricetes sp.]
MLAEITRAGLSRAQVEALIDEWVFSARDRQILRLKLLDGQTYEQIAEAVRPQMSPRQIKRIVTYRVDDLLKRV